MVSSASLVTTADCTLDTSKTCATGISGLAVNGSIYDVKFVVNGSYNTVYAANPSPFIGDVSGATAATAAIRSSLESAGVDGVLSYASNYDYFFVPTSVSSLVGIVYGGLFEPRSRSLWFNSLSCSPTAGACLSQTINYITQLPVASYNWSVFTAASVPAPATLGLLVLGLLGFGFNNRKHRHFTAKS